ncbi:DddA-like double-stranded DNA deaminase toxin [Streptomyces sp. NPDC058011]|uniref:DddA-like double-stranded DNA deaminase toxin n=1 Tax=Streptomyces sp. NPDC058011 TaxID=3346305 RepID=UPI0036E75108
MSSGKDGISKELSAYLKNELGYGDPRQISYFAETHVETKLAYWMLKGGVESASVVINNNKGVCKGRDTCTELVKEILPEDHTLTVYHPGKGSPDILIGRKRG